VTTAPKHSPDVIDNQSGTQFPTLQKMLQAVGIADRRSIRRAIASGEVAINGRTTTDPHATVDPGSDTVTVKGKRIPPVLEEKVYYVLNKPRGVISSLSDPQGRPTIRDFFRDVTERIYPVGRLDFLSEGLMLLTNDGDLTNHVISPRNQIPKEYQVEVEGRPAAEKIERLLSHGLVIDRRRVKPREVTIVRRLRNHRTRIRITLVEGKKHIVRNIFASLGHPVRELRRLAIGSLRLKNLPSGGRRKLGKNEVDQFMKNCGFVPPPAGR
jgi:23S rRNA pseudouridine2605 synthase